jgi:diketogulonate reductase-like aldo/keto reductase
MNNIHPFKSRIGFGTSGFGNIKQRERLDIEALESSLAVGYRMFDTAEMYGNGCCEILLGNAIRVWNGSRQDLQIVSKVLPENATSKTTVIDACRRSLDKLQTDYLDVYLLHWREHNTDLIGVIEAFEELKSQGRILHYGVSNFNPGSLVDWRVRESQFGIKSGACVLQTRYSLNDRLIDKFLLNHVRDYPMSVMAHSPFQLGKIMQRQDQLRPLAEENSCTVAQLCLAWILRHDHVVVIPKSGHKDRQRENLAADKIQLKPETFEQLEMLFPVPSPQK